MLIPPKVFEISRCASVDVARAQLCCVRLERRHGHVEACATTGKVLAVGRWKEPDWEEYPSNGQSIQPTDGLYSFSVPIQEAKKLAKRKLKSNKPILNYLAMSEDTAITTISSTDLDTTQKTELREEYPDYPDYRGILPDSADEQASVLVNVGCLKTLCETIIKMRGLSPRQMENGDKSALIRLVFNGPEKPIALETQSTAEDDVDVTAYTMPFVANK